MEVECALLDGEQDSEMAQLHRDKELLEQLKGKLHKIEKASNSESGVKSGSQVFIRCSKQHEINSSN